MERIGAGHTCFSPPGVVQFQVKSTVSSSFDDFLSNPMVMTPQSHLSFELSVLLLSMFLSVYLRTESTRPASLN